ncbi:dTMP kinase [Geosmithia morbida]|uniref:Thymidylate kinase n=1 Tax=Geosmithia morbida TaxID=1094350 RepID=A0A9P5CYN4_9HYPO|nr:dTMP kinase [Geosmithia morbida]KAF4120633.1 dTMP kinase [Geosmithia morbida]
MPPRGAFIVLEGLDRSGKTTQVKLLEERLRAAGRPVKTMRFPDRSTTIGGMIDGYLKSDVELEDHVIHLLFSANRWETARTIISTLEQGTSIICDRYVHSGIVYSAAKGNPSLDVGWASAPERGLPRPDRVVFLDLTPEETSRRGGWGDELYEKAEMQNRVRRLFRGLAGEGEAEAKRDEDVVVVSAAGAIDTVAENIWQVVEGVIDGVSGEPRMIE